MERFFVYILECDNGSFYTGYCRDIEKRMVQHFTGKGGARYTRAFRPVKILALWSVRGEKGDAMRIEAFIKGLRREEKVRVSEDPSILKKVIKDSPKKELLGGISIRKGNPEKIELKIKDIIQER